MVTARACWAISRLIHPMTTPIETALREELP